MIFSYPQPIAVYPASYGAGQGLHIYRIDPNGHGTLVLEVTSTQIAAGPEMPAVNTLIASSADGSVQLYRLTTGEFQINAGDYVIVFDGLSEGTTAYHP